MTALTGATAIVTGGSRGLGRAIARKLAADGASVIAASRAPAHDSEQSSGEVGTLVWHQVDVTNPSSVDTLVDYALHRFGRLDIAIANAGVSQSARLVDLTPTLWAQTLQTNLTGAFNLIRSASQPMLEQRYGRLITVSSCMAHRPAVGTTAYSTSKAGLEALTQSAALELGGHGVTATCVVPGILDEGLGAQVKDNERIWKHYEPHLVAGRRGTVAEVAKLVAFFARPECGYLNGATVEVDGGISTWA